jgi:hypothetical protein
MNSLLSAAAVLVLSTASLIVLGQGAQAPAGAAGQAPAAGAGRGGGARGGRGGAAAAPAAPTPRLANGKPDLSGHWNEPYTNNMAARGSVLDPKTRMSITIARLGEAFPDAPHDGGGRGKTYDLPYTELGLKHWKEYDPVKNGDYAGSCLPFGMSRNMNSPHGSQFVHSNDALAILWEQNTWFTFIPIAPMNPLKWPEDIPESWNGVSTGRYDGDTLIIETKGFNGYTKLDTTGHPHSKDMILTNTFLRTDAQTMTHTVTVHDPKMYTVDWMNVRTWRLRAPGDVLMEYSCEENNGGIYDGSITPWKKPVDE